MNEQIITLLKEIRDAQQEQLKRQDKALALQQEQYAMVKIQFDRAEKLNDKAEAIQKKSASLIANAGKLFKIIVPILILLIAYLSWQMFR